MSEPRSVLDAGPSEANADLGADGYAAAQADAALRASQANDRDAARQQLQKELDTATDRYQRRELAAALVALDRDQARSDARAAALEDYASDYAAGSAASPRRSQIEHSLVAVALNEPTLEKALATLDRFPQLIADEHVRRSVLEARIRRGFDPRAASPAHLPIGGPRWAAS